VSRFRAWQPDLSRSRARQEFAVARPELPPQLSLKDGALENLGVMYREL